MFTSLLALALLAPGPPPVPSPSLFRPLPIAEAAANGAYCGVVVTVDYQLGVVRRSIVMLDPDCPEDGRARVRKRGTLNLGARYQPIKPLTGAWNLTREFSGIPPNELWALYTWRWEYWTGYSWVPAEER